MSELSGFFVSRALVSAGFSLAMQSVPELLQHSVEGWANLSSTMDSVNAVVAFVSRPLWANMADAVGRKPCLVLGCLCSGWARIFWSQQPSSSNRYIFYRMINVIANIPITQATSVMLIDYCGGRTTTLYNVMHRRMWIMLAVVRVIASAWASRTASASRSCSSSSAGPFVPPSPLVSSCSPFTSTPAIHMSPQTPQKDPTTSQIEQIHSNTDPSASHSSQTSMLMLSAKVENPARFNLQRSTGTEVPQAATQLKWAGRMSLLAGLFFLLFSRETLRTRNFKLLFRNPFLVWTDSFLFFFRTAKRRKIAPFLLLRSFPNYSMILHLQFDKLCGFTGQKRARVSMFENLMDMFVPLVLNEMLQFSCENMLLSMRISNLCDSLRILFPSGPSRYFNAVADRVACSSRDYNSLLQCAQGTHAGEASLEAAVDSLCFPLSILLPRLYYFLSSRFGVRPVLWTMIAVGVINSEFYYPHLKRAVQFG